MTQGYSVGQESTPAMKFASLYWFPREEAKGFCEKQLFCTLNSSQTYESQLPQVSQSGPEAAQIQGAQRVFGFYRPWRSFNSSHGNSYFAPNTFLWIGSQFLPDVRHSAINPMPVFSKNLPCSTTFILSLNLTMPFPRAHEIKVGNSAVQDVGNVSAIYHFPQIFLPLAFGLYLNMGGTWNCHQKHGHKTDKRGPKAHLRDSTHTHMVTGWKSPPQ